MRKFPLLLAGRFSSGYERRVAAGVGWKALVGQGSEEGFFFEKKKQKTSFNLGLGRFDWHGLRE